MLVAYLIFAEDNHFVGCWFTSVSFGWCKHPSECEWIVPGTYLDTED